MKCDNGMGVLTVVLVNVSLVAYTVLAFWQQRAEWHTPTGDCKSCQVRVWRLNWHWKYRITTKTLLNDLLIFPTRNSSQNILAHSTPVIAILKHTSDIYSKDIFVLLKQWFPKKCFKKTPPLPFLACDHLSLRLLDRPWKRTITQVLLLEENHKNYALKNVK